MSQHAMRLAALLEGLTAAHLDGVLLTSLPNIRYLTGFSGTSAVLFVSHRDTILLTDFRYQTQVRDEVFPPVRVVVEAQSLWAGLWSQLGQVQSLAVVGFESGNLLHRDFQRLLEQGARYQWRPTLDLVERLRERKDEGEVALIARAAEVADTALGAAVAEIRVGMSELAIAGLLERALRDAGSEDFPFPSIIASGPRSALPHARSTGRAIGRGDLLLVDFGAMVSGYCSDVSRTFVVGAATREQRDVHEVVRIANERASAAVQPGMTGRDADAVARDYIERCGFGELFGHSLGHGIGLEVHEAPRLARAAEGALQEGAVVTIEPGVYRPGWGGVRIEDDVHLTHDGPRILTSFTRELLELG